MTEHDIDQTPPGKETPLPWQLGSRCVFPYLRPAGLCQGHGYDDEFNGFFRKEYSRVVKVVMYAGATLEEGEDAVSLAMARAYVRWPLLTQPDAWVRIVALRNYLKEVAKDRRRGHLETKAARRDCLDRVPVKVHAEPDERSRVIAVLRRLPPAQLAIMALIFDGYTPTEIAQMLNQDTGTVRSNLRHARKKLRDEFDKPPDRQAVVEKGASNQG